MSNFKYKTLSSILFSIPRPLFYSITVLGIASTVTQVVILREFLSVFYGNELVIGVILANWLFLFGMGTILGKRADKIRSPILFLSWVQLVISILPFLSVLAVRLSKGLFPTGETVGLVALFLLSGLALAPFCLLSGFIHPLACVLFSEVNRDNRIGEVYFLDVLGDILGGLLFSFVLVFWFNSVSITCLLFGLNLTAVGLLLLRGNFSMAQRIIPAFMAVLLACSATWLFFVHDPNRWSIEKMFPNQEIFSSTETPYGFLTATRTGKQINIFENGAPVYSTGETVRVEENVHYAMLQHPNPKRVLLVSGGTGAVFREIAKYDVESVDYVELDPKVVEWNQRYGELKALDNVRVINIDGRRFIKQAKGKYDVILLCLPPPNTAALNRYYTLEFYLEAQRVLGENGVLSFGLVPMGNYFNKETRKLLSVQFQTLTKVFPYVETIPGSRVFFLAGNAPVTSDVLDLLLERPGLYTHFLNYDVLEGFITPDRLKTLREAVREEVKVNRDFAPSAYLYQLLIWLKLFQEKGVWLVIGLGVILVLFITRLGPETFVMFSSGFSGSCLSVVLILMFQVIHGYVYYMLGLLVTAFMAGMAVGTLAGNLRAGSNDSSTLISLEWAITVFSFMAPVLIPVLTWTRSPSWAPSIAIPFLLFVLGGLVGMEFSVISRMLKDRIAHAAGQIYSADYFGAAVGAILTSVLLVPLLGFYRVFIAVGMLHMVSLFVLYKGGRRVPLSEAAAIVLYIALFGFLILGEGTGERTYVLSYHPVYVWSMVLSLVAISCLILFWRDRFKKDFARRAFRTLSVIGFIPMIAFPIFKCWFIIPYLYCHVCPRKCVFGFVRFFTVTMTCLQNLHHLFWCNRLCPIGILQDSQCSKGRTTPSRFKNPVRFGVLGIFVLTYFWIQQARRHPQIGPGTDLFLFMFTNKYEFSVYVFTITLIIFFVSFFVKRFFCDCLCPIGAFGSLVVRLDQLLAREWPKWRGSLKNLEN